MGQFSEDGRWWWDGKIWTATAQVVLPQLPPTEIELSGKLALARADLAKGRPAFWGWTLLLSALWLSPVNRRGFREYRTWTIEQLALATSYLLGPDEPMLAGEMSRSDEWDGWTRNLAVSVTPAHVIVFRIDHLDGQPRWIAMAARATDVKMRRVSVLFGWSGQWLEVTGPNGRWSIHGFAGDDEFNPEPVLNAWRKAANTTTGKR
jgi:hypothetical protein